MSGEERASDDTATLTVAEPSGVDVDRLPIEKETGLIGERYALLGVVGRGGMGAVLRAYDSRLRREVALKRLLPGKDAPDARARMIREAQAMAQLSHPNVVAVYDVDVVNDMVLIAMEYVQGPTLRRWLKTQRSVREIIDAFIMAAEGLAAAHDAGLVHRDFKPANVLVGPGHQIKVTDFGLAKPADGEEIEPIRGSVDAPFNSENSSGTVTQHNAVLGTPRYMAPEQLTGGEVDLRADLYAVGVILADLLGHAGEPVPSELMAVVDRLRAESPRDRPDAALDAADLLTPFTTGPATAPAAAPAAPSATDETSTDETQELRPTLPSPDEAAWRDDALLWLSIRVAPSDRATTLDALDEWRAARNNGRVRFADRSVADAVISRLEADIGADAGPRGSGS